MCRSEPQTPARVSLTRMAPGSTFGTGYSRSSNSPPYARSTATRPFIRSPSGLGGRRLGDRRLRCRRAATGAVGPCRLECALAGGAHPRWRRARGDGRLRPGCRLVLRRDTLLELFHRFAQRLRQVRELTAPEQHQHDDQNDHELLSTQAEHVCLPPVASILWPARCEYEGAQGAPHRAIPELGRDRGGYRLLDLAERLRAALHDRAQDRVALDQPDCRIGGGRARAGLLD